MAAILKELHRRRARKMAENKYPRWTIEQCKDRINTYWIQNGTADGIWDKLNEWMIDYESKHSNDPDALHAMNECLATMTLAWDELYPAQVPTTQQEDVFSVLDEEYDAFSALDGELTA